MPKEALESISLGEEMSFMDPTCPLTSEAPSCLLSWKTVFKLSHKKCWLAEPPLQAFLSGESSLHSFSLYCLLSASLLALLLHTPVSAAILNFHVLRASWEFSAFLK